MIAVKEIETFYQEFTKLNNTLRTGWVIRKISEERLEDVSHHTFQMGFLAITLIKELNIEDIDIGKVLTMCLVHDLGEAVIGDIAVITNYSKEDKHKRERQAVKDITSCLSPSTAEYYLSIWDEFEERSTKEAVLVYQIDKLDGILKADIYEKEYNKEGLFKEFYQYEKDKGTYDNGPLKDFFDEYGKEHTNSEANWR